MEDRKRWGRPDVQVRVNIVGLTAILWKPCLQSWHLAGIRELRFQMAPSTLSENEQRLCPNCTNPGLSLAPTFLLGVWNFELCQAEGAYVTSSQWKLCHWVLSFPGRQAQASTKKSVTEAGCTEKLAHLAPKEQASVYLNRKGWMKVLLESYGTLPFSSSDQCQNSEFMSWCPWSVLQIPRNIKVAIKLLLIWK